MALEAFLVNPVKRRRRKGGGKRRRKLFGAAAAMHAAKVAGRPLPYGRGRKRRKYKAAHAKTYTKRRKRYSAKRKYKSYYKKRRRSYGKARRRTVRYFAHPKAVMMINRKRRRRRYRRNPYLGVVNRPRRRYRSNPRRRRYRRNPAFGNILSLPAGVTLMKSVSWFAVAGASAVVTSMAPSFLPVSLAGNQWARYGAQIGAGLIGYWALSKYAKRHDWALVFLAVSGGAIFANLISTYVLGYFVPMASPAPAVGAPAAGTVRGIWPSGYGQVGAFTQLGGYGPGEVATAPTGPYAHRMGSYAGAFGE